MMTEIEQTDVLAQALYDCDAADETPWNSLLRFEREHYRTIALRLKASVAARGLAITAVSS